ncbi:MAG: hypothetical protein ACLT8C_06295 [Akkermansia muciniphila]
MGEGFLQVLPPGSGRPELMGTRLACASCGQSFPELEPYTFSFNSPRGWCPVCRGHGIVGKGKVKEDHAQSLLEAELKYDRELARQADDDKGITTCPACRGVRLNEFARSVRLQGVTPGDIASLPAVAAAELVKGWRFEREEALIARDVVAEITQRLDFLSGWGWATFPWTGAPRRSPARKPSASAWLQLGSHLRGVLYVLDEPTIGLHPRDNECCWARWMNSNAGAATLLVVEHDEDTMRRADHIVDMGPGAGIHGGRIMAQGTFEELAAMPDSVTGAALHHKPRHPYRGKRRRIPSKKDESAWLRVEGCRLHNLKDVNAAIPKGRLTVLTGVSGGKPPDDGNHPSGCAPGHRRQTHEDQRELWKTSSANHPHGVRRGQSPIVKRPVPPGTYWVSWTTSGPCSRRRQTPADWALTAAASPSIRGRATVNPARARACKSWKWTSCPPAMCRARPAGVNATTPQP